MTSAPATTVRTGGRPTAAAASLLEATILNHATAVFLREGYAATSIEAVAREARVAKRTIYARWTGKPALFLAVLQRLMATWLSTADAWPEIADLSTALTNAARSILTVGLTPEAIALHRLMIAEAARFPELQTMMAQAGAHEGVRRIAALLDQAVATGELAALDTVFAAEQFLHLVLAGPQRRAVGLGPGLDGAALEAWGDNAVRLFLLGCRSRDGNLPTSA
jgi:TetR/AcrR family transcriptional regulator, mexJK operon transcriptional repressor